MRALIIISFLTCSCILRGQVWTNLIDSIPNQGWAHFVTATVDSTSNTLYLGGQFWRFNQFNTNSIIRYNGSSFDTLQSGLNDFDYALPQVATMIMFQNKLYVGGNFQKTGKYWCKNLGRWNGTSWDTTNFNPNGTILSLEKYNNELYVSGNFTSIGGISANGIAKFDGVNWYSLNHPAGLDIIDFKFFNGKLYKVGMVTPASSSANLSYFDGTNWIPWVGVDGDNNKGVEGITVIDTMMYVYGRFNSIAGTNCKGLVAFNGKKWFGLGSGLSNSQWETIYKIEKINGVMYIYGHYNTIEGISTGTVNGQVQMYTNIVKFDGVKFCTFSPPFGYDIHDIVGFNNNIFALGSFRKIGNDSVWGFVRWDGGNTIVACTPAIAITPSAIGIQEYFNFSNLKIYPNPFTEKLFIEILDFDAQKYSFTIYNQLGEIVRMQNNFCQNAEIDLSSVSSGMYFVKIQIGGNQKTFKVTKQ